MGTQLVKGIILTRDTSILQRYLNCQLAEMLEIPLKKAEIKRQSNS